MRVRIELDVHHDKRDVEHGCVDVTRDDKTSIKASWTVEGGKGHGFDDVDCTIPELTDEQADAIADAACDAVWGGIGSHSLVEEGDGVVSLDWQELVEVAKDNARIGAWPS